MSRIKNAKNGISVGLLNYLISVICPFVIRTIMIRTLGNEYLGINSLYTSILQVLSLSELGVGVAIAYLMYKPIACNDVEHVNSILNLYKHIYRLIGTIILIVSLVLMPFLPHLIKGDHPADINLHILYIIYVANSVMSYFMFAYKRVVLDANQRYDLVVMVTMFSSLVKYVFQIILLIAFQNYYLYAIMLPISTVIDNIVCSVVVEKKYPMFKATGKVDKAELRGLLKNTGGAFCSKIGNTLYVSFDSIIISSVLGLNILGIYNNYYYVITVFIALFSIVHNTLRPIIGNCIVDKSREENYNLFRQLYCLYMWIVIVVSACCISLLDEFEMVWGGKGNLLECNISILLVICFFVNRITAIHSVYLEAAGILWKGKFIPLISAFVNLVTNIVLIQLIGLKGVVISSILAGILVNLPGYTWIVKKYIFDKYMSVYSFLLIYVKYIIKAVICVICCWKLSGIYIAKTWVELVLKGCIVFVFANLIVCVLFFKDKDFRKCNEIIRKILSSNRKG